MSKSKSASKSKVVSRDRTSFEWAILGLALAAIAAIVLLLIVSSLRSDTGEADLSVAVEPMAAEPNRFLLTVTNEGGATAEAVHVEVVRGPESVEVEFIAIPKGDEEEAIVEVEGTGPPTAHVLTYQEP